jgi:hypothetical protein
MDGSCNLFESVYRLDSPVLRALCAHTLTTPSASTRVLEKCGMTYSVFHINEVQIFAREPR